MFVSRCCSSVPHLLSWQADESNREQRSVKYANGSAADEAAKRLTRVSHQPLELLITEKTEKSTAAGRRRAEPSPRRSRHRASGNRSDLMGASGMANLSTLTIITL